VPALLEGSGLCPLLPKYEETTRVVGSATSLFGNYSARIKEEFVMI